MILKTHHRLLSTASPLTYNNSTLAAKILCFDTLLTLRSKSVTKYFAHGILGIELIVIYDF